MTMLWDPNNAERVKDDMGNNVSLIEISKMDYSKVTPVDQARLSLYLLLPCVSARARLARGFARRASRRAQRAARLSSARSIPFPRQAL